MSYKVQKNIELKPKSIDKYPFNKMELNDSFVVEFSDESDRKKKLSSVHGYVVFYRSKLPSGFKIKTKRESDTSFRVWRIV